MILNTYKSFTRYCFCWGRGDWKRHFVWDLIMFDQLWLCANFFFCLLRKKLKIWKHPVVKPNMFISNQTT